MTAMGLSAASEGGSPRKHVSGRNHDDGSQRGEPIGHSFASGREVPGSSRLHSWLQGLLCALFSRFFKLGGVLKPLFVATLFRSLIECLVCSQPHLYDTLDKSVLCSLTQCECKPGSKDLTWSSTVGADHREPGAEQAEGGGEVPPHTAHEQQGDGGRRGGHPDGGQPVSDLCWGVLSPWSGRNGARFWKTTHMIIPIW